MKCTFCSTSTLTNSKSNPFTNQPDDAIVENQRKADVEKIASKTNYIAIE